MDRVIEKFSSRQFKIILTGMNPVKKLFSTPIVFHLIFIIILLVLLLPIFRGGELAYGDFAAIPTSLKEAFQDQLTFLKPLSHGIAGALQVHLFVIYIVALLLSGNHPPIASHLIIFFAVALAYFNSFSFLKKFSTKQWVVFLGSIFYSLNTIMIGLVAGGPVGILYIYALTPLIAGLLYNLIENINNQRSFIKPNFFFLILLYAFVFGAGAYPAIFILVLILILSFKYLFSRRYKELVALLSMFAILMGTSIILNLPVYSIGQQVSHAVSTENQSRENFKKDLETLYNRNPIEEASLLSLPQVFSFPEQLLAEVLIIGGLIYYFILQRKKKKKHQTYFGLIIAILIISTITLIHYRVLFPLFYKFPILFMFRNPTKLLAILSFAYSVIFVGLIDTVLKEKWKRYSRPPKIIVGAGIIAFLFLFLKSSVITHFGIKQRPISPFIPSHYYDISKKLAELEAKEGNFRTIWLPWGYEEEQVKTRWLDKRVFALPLGFSSFFSSPISRLVESLFALSGEDINMSQFGQILGPAGVKYIIFNKITERSEETKYDYNKALSIFDQGFKATKVYLEKQPDFSLIFDSDEYSIYKNNLAWPSVRVYSDVVNVLNKENKNEFLPPSKMLKANLYGNGIIRQADNDKEMQNKVTQYVAPNEIIKDDFSDPEKSIFLWNTYGKPLLIQNGKLILTGDIISGISTNLTFGPGSRFRVKVKYERADCPLVILTENVEQQLLFDFAASADPTHLDIRTLNSEGIYRQGEEGALRLISREGPGTEHTYEIEWGKEEANFYIDGKLVTKYTEDIPNKRAKFSIHTNRGQTLIIDNFEAEFTEASRLNYSGTAGKLIYEDNPKLIPSGKYQLSLKTSTDKAYIHLTEPYSENWRAHDNGKPLTPFKSYGGFQGFEVESVGEHRIALEYAGINKINRITDHTLVAWAGLSVFTLMFFIRARLNDMNRRKTNSINSKISLGQ